MTMDGTQVVTGQYWDYGRGAFTSYRWLYSQSWAAILTQFLGILLTIALPRAVKLFRHTAHLAEQYNQRQQANWPGIPLADPADFNIPIEGEGWRQLLDAIAALRPGAIALPGAAQPASRRHRFVRAISLALLLLGIYLAFVACGVLTSQLVTDNIALSDAVECGVYAPLAAGTTLLAITTPYESDVQTDSAKYAQECYRNSAGGEGCNLFLQQSIPYHFFHNATCPFLDDMCYGGANQSYTLSTGAVPARALGINTRSSYEFNHTTTCTPLNMNDTFITESWNGTRYTFSYFYGRSALMEGNNLTWQTFTNGDFSEKTPSYSVGAFVDIEGGFEPTRQLSTAPDSNITLLFILPGKIYYRAPSDDPIFPAESEQDIPDIPGRFWMYLEGYGRPLACVDSTKWRNLDESTEWHNRQQQPPENINGEFPGDLWLFWFALRNAITYQSISTRLANGLNATARISGLSSLPLEQEQWKVEATQLFETTLARIQFEARNMARGVYARYPGYRKLAFESSKQEALCHHTYLFAASGWSNINALWYLVTLVPCSLIVLAAWVVSVGPPEILLLEWILGNKAEGVAHFIVHVVPSLTAKAFKRTKNILRKRLGWTSNVLRALGRLIVGLWR